MNEYIYTYVSYILLIILYYIILYIILYTYIYIPYIIYIYMQYDPWEKVLTLLQSLQQLEPLLARSLAFVGVILQRNYRAIWATVQM